MSGWDELRRLVRSEVGRRAGSVRGMTREDREDVEQDAMIRLARRGTESAGLERLVKSVVLGALVDWIRRNRQRLKWEQTGTVPDGVMAEETVEAQVIWDELEEEERSVLVLMEGAGLTSRDVMDVLGWGIARVRRVRKRLATRAAG